MSSGMLLERQAVFLQEIHRIIELFGVGNVVSHMQTAVSCSSTLLTVTTLQISLSCPLFKKKKKYLYPLFLADYVILSDPALTLKYIRLDTHKMSHTSVSRMTTGVSLQLKYLC